MAGKGERREALADLDPTVRKLIQEKEKPRQRRRYPSEEGRVKATWDLPPELLQRIRALAGYLGVAQYQLVEKLLRDGLDRYEAGDLELKPKLVMVADGLE